MGILDRNRRFPVTAGDSDTEQNTIPVLTLDSDAGVTTDDGGASDLESAQGLTGGNDGLQSGQIRIFRRSQYRRMARPIRHPAVPVLTQPKVNHHSGSKKFRRYENQLELLKECDETEQQEVSIEDLIGATNTSRTFTKMLQEENMLEVWNKYLDQKDQDPCKGECKRSPKKNNNQNRNPDAKFDPDSQFGLICRKLRTFIKQRHFPLGVMENLEQDLLEFFTGTDGKSKEGEEMCYISIPLDAYRRAVIHALCAYSNLRSSSIKCKEQQEKATAKQVRVQPSSPGPYQPPSPRLTEYLERKYHSPKKNMLC